MSNEPACPKCGGKLDPKQNYCMECLQPVYNLYAEKEEEKRPLPKKWIAVAVVALIILIGARIWVATRPMPPDQVAQKWLDKLMSFKVDEAMAYTTHRYESENAIAGGRRSSYDKAEEFKEDTLNLGATISLSKPVIKSGTPKTAEMKLIIKFPAGSVTEYNMLLIRQKDGKWLIDRID